MSDIERKIYDEQIRMIYNQATYLVAGATLCGVVVTLFLWTQLPHYALLFWLGGIGLSTAIRLWCIYLYLNADLPSRERPIWGPVFWLGSLTSGLIWGAWPLFFYSLYSAEHLLLISSIFAGMVAVSAAAGSLYLPSFLAFSVPLILPLSIIHLLSDQNTLALVGLLLILFFSINLLLAVRSSQQNRKLLESQLVNQKLLDSLAEEKLIAERAMVAKSRFLAAASHDLRQPLHAMGLFLCALRSRENEPQKMRIIEDMTKSADALNGLFNSLLDVSRLDAEIIEFNPAHVPANRMFDALRAQFVQQAAEKGVEVKIRACTHVLYCDAILLERVMRNLFSNAVQYTNAGAITLFCEDLPDGNKVVTLEDTGIGIPAEFAEDVFSEYYQLNNPSRDRSLGLGLGLSIVRRLCELMDVPLEMESIDGKGTVFRLTVPSGDPALIVAKSKPASGRVAPGRSVLVIDDELLVLQSMRHMLEGWGCDVMLAVSARDALRILAMSDTVPDIIISDYRLADNLNGVDAVAAVRESLEDSVPAIIVTGDTSPERLKEVKETGLQLLHKPVLPDELHEVIQALFKDSDRMDGDRIEPSLLPDLKTAANQ